MMPNWGVAILERVPVLAVFAFVVLHYIKASAAQQKAFIDANSAQQKAFMDHQQSAVAHIDLVSNGCRVATAECRRIDQENQKDQADAVRQLAKSHQESSAVVAERMENVAVALSQVVENLRGLNGLTK